MYTHGKVQCSIIIKYKNLKFELFVDETVTDKKQFCEDPSKSKFKILFIKWFLTVENK